MAIGTIIKQLRQEQNVTQEQLADALGITSRAVSQWECDRTAPDISQLPALANFFDVTTDQLLGVDIKRREEEVEKIIDKWCELNNAGETKAIIEYLGEKIKIYPKESRLLEHLAQALYWYYILDDKADTEESKAKISKEIISLCERALKYSKPNENNDGSKQTLVYLYIDLGERDKAKEIVESLSTTACTIDMLQPYVYEGKEALKKRQWALQNLMQMMVILFKEIYADETYTYEQRLEILETSNAMINLITGNKPNFYDSRLSNNTMCMAWCWFNLGDKEKTIDMLEASLDYAEKYETRPDGIRFAPCWLSELDDKREYVGNSNKNTEYDEIYNFITSKEVNLCEEFKGNERFESFMAKLREKISN